MLGLPPLYAAGRHGDRKKIEAPLFLPWLISFSIARLRFDRGHDMRLEPRSDFDDSTILKRIDEQAM
jgi:hypothetical protein